MSHQVDFLSRLISTIIPATVAETSRRFADMQSYNRSRDYMGLVEKVSADIVAECDFDVGEDSDAEDIPDSVQAKLELDSDLNHIQNLKLDLHELYTEFTNTLKHSIVDELKDSIKSELRMELFIELEKLKTSKGVTSKGVTSKQAPSSIIPEFTIDAPGIGNVFSGFDSISSKLNFNDSSRDVDAELLANNPIYAKVSRGLERIKTGKAAYTSDELISARIDRFGDSNINEFKNRVNASNQDFDDESDDEDERWNKLMLDKYTSEY